MKHAGREFGYRICATSQHDLPFLGALSTMTPNPSIEPWSAAHVKR